MNRVNFGVIADIHYGPDIAAKLGTTALTCLGDFKKAVKRENPDFIARLGDDISSTSPSEDRNRHATIEAEFNRMATPTYTVDGNHDRHLRGIRQQSHVKDVNGHRFIFWCPNVRLPSPIGLYLPQADIDWLALEVKNSDKPTIVFSHIPLDNEAEDNRRDLTFNKYTGLSFYYPQGPQIRDILEQSGKVVLCMAGHQHRDRLKTMNGIHYITQQSLTEEVSGLYPPKPYGAFSFVEITDTTIAFRRLGERAHNYTLQRKPVI